jgi:uncharacterized DUF497 family protein
VRFLQFLWDDPDDPDGNVQHIAEHGLTMDEVEFVMNHSANFSISDSSGRPCCFGHTPAGDHIIVVFEEPMERIAYPITAYPVSER